jgi:flagellar hook-associated protein 1 FlgK
VDEGLLKTLRIEIAGIGGLKVQDTFLSRIQTLFGSLDSNSALNHRLSGFEAAIGSLALSPNSALSQREVVRRGEELAASFRSLSAGVQSLRQDADQRITAAVTEVNSRLAEVADLNTKIFRNEHAGLDVTALKDQRDRALDRLSGLIDIRVSYRSDGHAVVYTAAGQTLVDADAVVLSHRPAGAMAAESAYAPGGTGSIDGIYAGEVLPENDITGAITGGELAGLIALRDQMLPEIQAGLDELAAQLKTTVNQVHNRGIPFPGLTAASGSRAFADPANQSVTFQSGDSRIVVFDAEGKQLATTTVQTLIGGASATVAATQTAIDGWLSAGGYGNASFDASGHLTITMASGRAIGFRDEVAATPGSAAQDAVIGFDADGDTVIDETSSGFSGFFGLNDFFSAGNLSGTAGVSTVIAVRSDLTTAPERVSRGAVQWDASLGLNGAYAASRGDGSVIQALSQAVADGATFLAAGGLPATTSGFADYAALLIGKAAADSDIVHNRAESQQGLVNDLQHKSDTVRGVNLDQELAELMLYEQAFAATARVMSAIQNMFDALERALP